jgi:Sortilin, neurotensin receptor 3,
MVLYAGTGEEDSRNSISPGCGVFKSTDGGMTWKHVGLTETRHIGRIVVDPRDPNVAYVAALGHAWGANPERGVYKTTDGGATWQRIKFVSDKAGFVDLAMDPSNPDVLFASAWERVRGPYFLRSGGPGSGLWKTTDAGKTWIEVKGGGFPETMKGRIGIALAPSNPKVVYALVEADTMPNPKPAKGAARQTRPSGLYQSTDGGATWTKMNGNDTRPFYYSQVRVDLKNPDRVYWSSTPFNFSDDGGKTVRNGTIGIHVDDHAMWMDPGDENHFLVGNDGGVAQTWDKGGNYEFLNSMAIGQFYAVSYDLAVPYRVCGGLQDNGSWCGPSRRKSDPITNAMWATFNGGDGFRTAQDPTDPDVVYGESQGGNVARYQWSTGERSSFRKPNWRERAQTWEDSVVVIRGDTTQPETAAMRKRLAAIAQTRAADSVNWDTRWNWNTPFFLSPHNPGTVYLGANRVMKSVDRGASMYPISPDLSTRDSIKIRVSTETSGGITTDVTGAETYGTIVALAESPIRPGLLYAGTDDGNVWLSRNDGGAWESLTGRFPGVPALTYVSNIEASSHDSATFYVTFDGHRANDFTPYVYRTTDFGKTFQSIASNLPTGGPDFVHVIREDLSNPKLLFLGTDVGAYLSTNGGGSWEQFMNGLPTVPVHDLRIHPRDRDLIAATHGRSIWIVDIGPLEQMTDSVLALGNHLFQPQTAYQWGEPPVGGEEPGQKAFEAPSPAYGAEIVYRLTGPAAAAGGRDGQDNGRNGGQDGAPARGGRQGPGRGGPRVQIAILDVAGDTVQTLNGPAGPGVHRVTWNYRGKQPPAEPLGPAARRDSIQMAERREFVFDSLSKAGTLPAPMAERIRTMLASGDTQGLFAMFGRGGGGGGGARPGGFNARPAESPLRGQRGGGAPGGAGQMDQGMMSQLFDLLRPPGRRGGFGAFFGRRRGGGNLAEPGDYLVSMTVGGKTYTQKLRVERTSGTGSAGGFFQEDDEH